MRALVFLTALLLSLATIAEPGSADEPPPPYVCTGYNPDRGDWELTGAQPMGAQEANCPRGYAFFSIDFPLGTPRPAAKIGVSGRCCRLPDGVLTDKHEYALERCPDNSVATGTKAARPILSCADGWARCVAEWESIDQYLRCTKLDETRFRLGAPTLGYTIGFNHPLGMEEYSREHFTSRGRIPVALRYGTTRIGRYGFDQGGFIGFPWGSVATGKRSKREIEFRSIEYLQNGVATPLKTYPECSHLSDPLDPYATCDGDSPRFVPRSAHTEGTQQVGSLSAAFRKHQLRVLQLASATIATMIRQRGGRVTAADSVAQIYPLHWQLSPALKLKEAITANILRLLADVEFQACAIRDRDQPTAKCEEVTSISFTQTATLVETVLNQLTPTASDEELDKTLTQVATIIKSQQAAFQQEHQLTQFDPARVIPIETAELEELQRIGLVPRGQSVVDVDRRSAAIVHALHGTN